MKVFASELSRCRVFKAVFGWLAVFFGFLVFIVFPVLWIMKAPIEKTAIDFAKEYIYERMNFTPSTVKKAYFNKLQYQFPLYAETVKDELNYIKKNSIYQLFVLQNIKGKDTDYEAEGILVVMSCKEIETCKKMKDEKVKVFISMPKKHKFVIKEIKQ